MTVENTNPPVEFLYPNTPSITSVVSVVDTKPTTLLEFLNIIADVLEPLSVPPEYDNVKLPLTNVSPVPESIVNLFVLNDNVVPLYLNKLSPIVFGPVAIGKYVLVKLVSEPYVPAVVPINLLDSPLADTNIQ